MENKHKSHKYGKGSVEHHKEKMDKTESKKWDNMPKSEKFGKSGSESRSESRGGLEYNHSYEEEE